MEGGVAPFSSAMAPSGSYILIIVGQPVTETDKESILDRLNKGLLSWDVESTGCDLNGLEIVCSGISSKHLDDTDVLIQHSTESLGVEVLVHPTVSTLKQCVKNLLSTSTGHKHLIHTGYTFAGSGSWILQNGTFSFDNFLEIFQQADVQNQKRCNINIHCSEVGLWNVASFAKDIFAKVANLAFNPPEKVSHVPGSEHLISCLRRVLNSQDLEEMMEASSLVGNIRFNRPTLYMFPAGQGDCALFGINGFNMLIDGGFNRKPCSWEFIRHLDRLDAVLVTRLCENNVCGMSTLMKRKYLNNTYPQIGYVFCNIPENKKPSSTDETGKDNLMVSVVNEGHNFIQTLNELKLKPHQCWRDSAAEPFVLYHKVGHGTLEMHVLSPPKDSKEMKDFISDWSSFKETFSSTKSGLKGKALDSAIPLSHATSICAVLIWRPADPKDTITRILFPGSAPQNKIFESLGRLKTLDVLSHPVVTKASLSVVVTKTVGHKVEKSVSRNTIPNRKNASSPALSVASVASRNGDAVGHKIESKEVKKVVKKEVKKEVKSNSLLKEKKETKTDIAKKDVVKKDASKEVKKEVKKTVKKDSKEQKPISERKPEIKTTVKKEASAVSKTVSDVKKNAGTTVRKSPITNVKKEAKQTIAPKTAEVRKSAPPKMTDLKSAKDISNKKVSEAKTVAKSKPKSANNTPKSAASAPKTKPVAVPKPGSKMTKAVAASSIVASAVAVTAAAFELNEKKEEIVADETELEVSDSKEPEIAAEVKYLDNLEKPEEEVIVSPLPPEALSPTPSDSVSLTPSDTLSSAPLETVSPTPPLANEPISTEEKEVNEIKDIEQDMPYEAEIADEIVDTDAVQDLEKESTDVNEIELELAKYQQISDVMSTSFVGSKDIDSPEMVGCAEIVQSSHFEAETVTFEASPMEKFDEIEKPVEEEKGYIIESKDIDVDDQLAQMSMEGSFCAGGYEVEETHLEGHDHENVEAGNYNQGFESTLTANTLLQEENEDLKYDEKHSFLQTDEPAVIESENDDIETRNSEIDNIVETVSSKDDFQIKETENYSCHATESQFKGHPDYRDSDFDIKEEVQEKEISSYKTHENGSSPLPMEADEQFPDEEYDQQQEIEALKETINRATNEDYEISRNIINDADMQETSVDEPEEVVRKESGVSITLNDEEIEDHYIDQLRRKSGTESEDDVDLQQYMLGKGKDISDHDKLNAQQDSDNEDVVKSPTPHAIVDYEDNMDDLITGKEVDSQSQPLSAPKDAYYSEKQDFDEKDHDSTEDQDIDDDGEMIRHPTPPEMKYSEEEMRDPIGQHYISTPGMKLHGTDITEQPLYEEEDEASDRSESPVVEQPVFGSVVEADFPELVTVSGGTTPSEPQSPKAGFDAKKFTAETGIMEALSEHDLSESSTHSPLCQNDTFDLPVTGEPLKVEHNTDKFASNMQELSDIPAHHEVSNLIEDSSSDKVQLDAVQIHPRPVCDAQSDDESYSQNEKSETRSEKSDDDDEKSNPRHDKSDMHDDKSDNQFDGKSDVMDDERRSDIHEDDRTDSHHDDKQDFYDEKRSDDPRETQESDRIDIGYEGSSESSVQKTDAFHQHSEFHDEYHSEVETTTFPKIGDVADTDAYATTLIEEDDRVNLPIENDFETLTNVKKYGDDYDTENVITACKTDRFDVPEISDREGFNIPPQFHDEEKPCVPGPYSSNSQCDDDLKSSLVDDQVRSNFEQIPTTKESGYEDNFSGFKGNDFEDTEAGQVSAPVRYEMDNNEFDADFLRGLSEEKYERYRLISDRFEEFERRLEIQTREKFPDGKIDSVIAGILKKRSDSKPAESDLGIDEVYGERSVAVQDGYGIPSSHISETSHFDGANFNYVAEESKSFSTTQSYETTAHESTSNLEQRFSDVENAQLGSDLPHANEGKFSPDCVENIVDSSKTGLNGRTTYEQSHEEDHYNIISKSETFQEVSTSEIAHENSSIDGRLPLTAEEESSFSRVNGKDQTSWSHTSDYAEQYSSQTNSSQLPEAGFSVSQQETSYIISSRFHSDSPEDNVMRSDSSPDVPYPPSKVGALSGVESSMEAHGNDFSNINLPKVGGVAPLSPNSKSRNVNRDDPYGESSEEDEDSSSVPGTVSPYAYTNKAYAKEDEDMDGNHIYKESVYEKNSEILNQVKFDGNNEEGVTTQQVTYSQGFQEREYTGSTNYDFQLGEWEKPMGLPTPPDSTKTVAKKTDKAASKTLGKSVADSNGKLHSPTVASKLSSPLKKPKAKESSSSPVYVDLAYVPHHGDPHYCDVEFFKKIRARYYVFSGINPSKEVLNALLEAKKTWKEDMEVTIIPTYETDTLGYWMAQNQDDLAAYSIEVAPSASRCTVNLQDHETSCAAYRLEF